MYFLRATNPVLKWAVMLAGFSRSPWGTHANHHLSESGFSSYVWPAETTLEMQLKHTTMGHFFCCQQRCGRSSCTSEFIFALLRFGSHYTTTENTTHKILKSRLFVKAWDHIDSPLQWMERAEIRKQIFALVFCPGQCGRLHRSLEAKNQVITNEIKWYNANVPAATMHLRQDFWSILGQMTYFASGPRRRFNKRRQKVSVIPVAIGTSRQASVLGVPIKKRN